MVFISDSGRISESNDTSKLLSPSVVSVSKFASQLDINNMANVETTTLVTPVQIHDIREGHAAFGAGDTIQHECGGIARIGDARDMRRHCDLGMAPQHIVGRQELGLE